MRSLVLVCLLFPLLCSSASAQICAILTAANYEEDTKDFCGYGWTATEAMADAKSRARDDGYRIPIRYHCKADTCTIAPCESLTVLPFRANLATELPWTVRVCIPCTKYPIEVEVSGRTYAEALNDAKTAACQVAAERNADPENPYKCACRYYVQILERPCQVQTCPPKPCGPQLCTPQPCAPQPCASQPCGPQLCAPQPCAPQTCAPKKRCRLLR